MSVTPQGIGSVLADLDAEQVRWAHATARRLESAGIAARVGSAGSGDRDWYLGDNFAFRPAVARRAPAGAAAESLVQALSDHDALLEQIEAATGYATEFEDHGALPNDAAVLLLSRDGEPLGELVVRVSVEDAAPPASGGHIQLDAVAARLALPEAEALSEGDLVILSPGPWPLAVPVEQGLAEALAFDPASGRVGPHLSNPDQPVESHTMSDTQPNPALAIPVAVRLADIALSPAEMASMAAGGTVDLGPVAEGLSVTLSVGGRAIGSGEIVRLGDRFGVLLDDPLEGRSADQSVAGEVDLEQELDSIPDPAATSEPLGAD